MPGRSEFTRAVGGVGSDPVATSQAGAFETDNYEEGGGFDHDGSAYPYTVDPADQFIQELTITNAGDVDAVITTVSGTTFTLRLAGSVGVWDKWSIDSVTFEDPRGTGAPISGGWAGE